MVPIWCTCTYACMRAHAHLVLITWLVYSCFWRYFLLWYAFKGIPVLWLLYPVSLEIIFISSLTFLFSAWVFFGCVIAYLFCSWLCGNHGLVIIVIQSLVKLSLFFFFFLTFTSWSWSSQRLLCVQCLLKDCVYLNIYERFLFSVLVYKSNWCFSFADCHISYPSFRW